MTIEEMKEIVGRNLSNASVTHWNGPAATVLRVLINFVHDAGIVEFEKPITRLQPIDIRFRNWEQSMMPAALVDGMRFVAVERTRCMEVFRRTFIDILYYGCPETREKVGTALLFMAADLGILSRSEPMFSRLASVLYKGGFGANRYEIEKTMDWATSHPDQPKPE